MAIVNASNDEEPARILKTLPMARRELTRARNAIENNMRKRGRTMYMTPLEAKCLAMARKTLQDRKDLLDEAGIDYPLNSSERKKESLEQRLNDLESFTFHIEQKNGMSTSWMWTFNADQVMLQIYHDKPEDPGNLKWVLESMNKSQFLQALCDLDLADWNYRFAKNLPGRQHEDSVSWLVGMVFSKGRRKKMIIEGHDSFPCNFEDLRRLAAVR